MQHKTLIIDGHNFLFRGYYGVPIGPVAPNNMPIQAVYGFFALIRNVFSFMNPTHMIIVFDTETGTQSKVQANANYKANRTYPDDIFKQLDVIKRILQLLNINWIEDDNTEADDIIGSYVNFLNAKEGQVYIASNDFDFSQLVFKNVSLLRGHHGDIDILNTEQIIEKFNVHPHQYVDYLALKGDKSDNIQGIEGIGPKHAARLVQTHNNIEGIFDNFSNLAPFYQKKLKNKSEYLLGLREFLRIDTKLYKNKLDVGGFEANNIELPSRMGMFIKENWERLA